MRCNFYDCRYAVSGQEYAYVGLDELNLPSLGSTSSCDNSSLAPGSPATVSADGDQKQRPTAAPRNYITPAAGRIDR